jgi:4-hydroxythreonine-4-phosphate dehydrogenase
MRHLSSHPQGSAPPIVLTMGDPAGIGPEIIVKGFCERPELLAQIVVAGDLASLARAARVIDSGTAPSRLHQIEGVQALASVPPGCMAVVQACHLAQPVEIGRVSAHAGRAAAECIHWAAAAALQGRARAVVTAPIHKEALALAGVAHPGHTEMLQALSAAHLGKPVSVVPVRMMLSCPGLSTVLVSIHLSLRQALDAVSTDQVLQTIRITHAHFERIGLARPRIAVAGLNPHAGEGGLFGLEDRDVIAPAIESARQEGLDASGPHAPDTVFMRARQGFFDVVVAMYHDQGLIPVKLLGLDDGVNTTLGLPFVRTSPDHGTAFDIAGTGRASASSLLAAIDAALAATVTF